MGRRNRKKWKFFLPAVLICIFISGIHGCGEKSQTDSGGSSGEAETDAAVSGLPEYDHSMETEYATGFSVDYYQEGYILITIKEEGQYLVVPEGKEAPEDLDTEITVLQQPLTNIYLAASSVMDMFVSLDALDQVRFSALESDGWYIDEAKEQMESGDLIYAGKYSAPDYELILSEGCSLAIENTMIYHTPEVKEQLENFDIPVLVDRSSYESEPMGRVEWVKLYGILTGHEQEAEEAFEEQDRLFKENSGTDDTGQTVAFFYITSSGAVNVRKSSDYLPKMIEMAGGVYIFDDLGGEESASSTVSMQMEEFYAAARDADYLIYNSSIEGELESMDDLLELSPLMENFKAVRENRVYCTTKNLYQSSMSLGNITSDIRKMLSGQTEGMTYLYQVKE